jgi:RimJ/RimL family protein N-acetyltransferase
LDKQLDFRNATSEDCDRVYSWVNDPDTRANSYQNNSIEYGDHVAWFHARIDRLDQPYLVFFEVLNPNETVGQVRFDRKPEGLVVGITVAPAHRGKGYAALMLKLAVNHLRNILNMHEPFHAWIKKGNTPSERAFISAGFSLRREELISGNPSFLYIY